MGEVEQRALLEVDLLLVLHLHDEVVTIVVRTINVIDNAPVAFKLRQQFLVQKLDVLDVPFSYQEVVQEVNQQVLADLLSEDSLEPYIGKRIDKLCHNIFFSAKKRNYSHKS